VRDNPHGIGRDKLTRVELREQVSKKEKFVNILVNSESGSHVHQLPTERF
jgi:hypothetical protein